MKSETTLAVILGVAGVGVAVAMIAAGNKRVHPEDPYLKHEREQAEAQARKAAAAATSNDVSDFGGRA